MKIEKIQPEKLNDLPKFPHHYFQLSYGTYGFIPFQRVISKRWATVQIDKERFISSEVEIALLLFHKVIIYGHTLF